MIQDESSHQITLMQALTARIGTAIQHGPQAVLEPEARREAEKLAELSGGRYSCDLAAAACLLNFHILRYRALPEDDDAWDHQQVTTWIAVIRRIDPRMLPPSFSILPELGDNVDEMALNAAAVEHADRYERTGDHESLQRAIALWRCGLDVIRCDRPGARIPMLSNLCGALATYADDHDDLDAADEAVIAGRQALRGLPEDSIDRAPVMAHLGVALQHRFTMRGHLADLDDSLFIGRASVSGKYATHPGRPTFLANLALTLRIGFQRTGRLAYLVESVSQYRRARSLETRPDSQATIDTNLIGSLLLLFEQTHQRRDIDEAVRIGREIVAGVPPEHPQLPGRLLNLSSALQTRATMGLTSLAEGFTDISEAVSVAREAVSHADERHPVWVLCQGNLAVVLQTRINFMSGLPVPHPDPREREADASEAAAALRAVLAASPEARPDRAGHLNNLGLVLRLRGRPEDLHEAVGHAGEAVALTAANHHNRTSHLSNWGSALEARFLGTGNRADLQEAFSAWKEASESTVGAPPARIAAAIKWGRRAAAQGDPDNAVAGYQAAVALLPVVAWRGLQRTAQEKLLGIWSGVACDAAAWALHNRRPDSAVQLLEQGHSVLWAQQLQTRTDPQKLAAVDPDLAARLDDIRRELDPSTIHGLTLPG
ncbi:hypothetical protein [Sphaerisporangium aureirubrum]|uniref:Tetratricopeptide repeat protein n=1 Tax=Sphaerisporangium aureirubrum TaxID=1544736 RepID=A0ABW1NIP2_9ACTN